MNWSSWSSIALLPMLVISCSNDPVSKDQSTPLQQSLSDSVVHPVQARKLSKGEAHYIRYCSDCHGWEGRGDGVNAELMRLSTPALDKPQLLATKSESQFVDWVLHGSSSTLSLADNAGPQTDAQISALLTYMRQLPKIDWVKMDAGQEVYDQLCVNCHGIYGRGDGVLASRMPVKLPNLSAAAFQDQRTDEELIDAITNGKNAMPSVDEALTAAQIKSVTMFVRMLSPGYENFDRYCLFCHEPSGTPAELLTLDEDDEYESINIPVFNADYFNTHSDAQLRPRIQHMLEDNSASMPHFDAVLQPEEVRQIYHYLNSLNPASP